MTWVYLVVLLAVWFISGHELSKFLLWNLGEFVRQISGRDALYSEWGDAVFGALAFCVFFVTTLGLIALNIPIL